MSCKCFLHTLYIDKVKYFKLILFYFVMFQMAMLKERNFKIRPLKDLFLFCVVNNDLYQKAEYRHRVTYQNSVRKNMMLKYGAETEWPFKVPVAFKKVRNSSSP
jgi:hypothetical protein